MRNAWYGMFFNVFLMMESLISILLLLLIDSAVNSVCYTYLVSCSFYMYLHILILTNIMLKMRKFG